MKNFQRYAAFAFVNVFFALIATVCNAQVPKDTGDVDPAAVSQDARDASHHEWIKSGKMGVDIVRRADGSLERISMANGKYIVFGPKLASGKYQSIVLASGERIVLVPSPTALVTNI